MSTSFARLIASLLLASVSSCAETADYSWGNVSLEQERDREYFVIKYNFGDEFFCTPQGDVTLNYNLRIDQDKNFTVKTFNNLDIEDILSNEGGRTNRLSFFRGKGEMYLPRGKGGSGEYFVRLVRCKDIFAERKNIKGYILAIK